MPRFEFPEDAAGALARSAKYQLWRTRPPGAFGQPDACRPDEAAALLAQAVAVGDGWLDPQRTAVLLNCYGIPVVATRIVHGPQKAVAAAVELGGPVALKAYVPSLRRKSSIGAVRLGLLGEVAVRTAAREIGEKVRRAGRRLDGLAVQPMATPGVELMAGVVVDQSFGPVIACGAGGPSGELLGDVAVRITPLSDLDAAELVRSLRTFPLLSGYDGATPCDVRAVEDVLLRLSALVEAHREIVEVEVHPLIAGPEGVQVVDAQIRVRDASPREPLASLRT